MIGIYGCGNCGNSAASKFGHVVFHILHRFIHRVIPSLKGCERALFLGAVSREIPDLSTGCGKLFSPEKKWAEMGQKRLEKWWIYGEKAR